jgi:hypothetical protein
MQPPIEREKKNYEREKAGSILSVYADELIKILNKNHINARQTGS